ncbi:MAG: hypothetical protein ACO20X_15140 [Alphaproteobacteria bacterium]
MELHPLMVRVDPKIVEGMAIIKHRTRDSYAKQAEQALRDWVAKHGLQLEPPKTDG